MSVQFTVAATSSGGALSYQWQDNRSGSFASCIDGSGATTATYTAATTTYGMRGRQYRCVVTDSNGSVTSSAATLTVNWIPSDVYLRAVPSDTNPNDVRLYDPTTFGSGATIITASNGAWRWAGVAASIAVSVIASVGAFNWTGVKASVPTQITATKGAYTWAGTTASISKSINATKGAYTWAGTQAAVPRLVKGTTGAYTWQGQPANFGSLTTISAGVGAFTWRGTSAAVPRLVKALSGSYTWSGTPATFGAVGVVNASTGAYTLAGTGAKVPRLVAASSGAYVWSGVNSTLVQQITVNGLVGAWNWQGVRATFGGTTPVVGGHGSDVSVYSEPRIVYIDGKPYNVRSKAEYLYYLNRAKTKPVEEVKPVEVIKQVAELPKPVDNTQIDSVLRSDTINLVKEIQASVEKSIIFDVDSNEIPIELLMLIAANE